jgi:D-alanyl-D-alanine dipeptidase
VGEELRDTSVGPLYRAEDATGLPVAVLLLGSTTDSSALALLPKRFLYAIQVQHPNVATIRELGETEDKLAYVVAELLTGELLSETLIRRGALPLGEALDLCLQAASGLQAGHEVGWAHGRLSPDTILLTSRAEGCPLVKLIGFTPEFLLREGDAEPPIDQGVNLEYASPERAAGDPPDQRADVYSLGAVLHHLLTGVRPKLGGTPPKAIRGVLDRALDPSPARRFQTMLDFMAALRPLGEPEALSVPEPTRAARRKLLPNLWPEERAVVAAVVAVMAGLWLLWAAPKFWTHKPSQTRFEESGAVAPLARDSNSSSSVASSSATSAPARRSAKSVPPARRLAKSAPASPVPRESVSSRLPASSGPGPTASNNAAADSLLVDVRSIDPTIQTDIRYATANNFTGAPLPGYETQRALLRPEAAAALARVQAKLRGKGLGLRILDAYRPVRASVAMVEWAKRTGNRSLLESGYIAERSRHNLGLAVDLTLVDLVRGSEVMGTTEFDNFSATADTAQATGQALRYRQVLIQTMKSEGFSPYGQAWWHFNYPLEGALPLDQVIR